MSDRSSSARSEPPASDETPERGVVRLQPLLTLREVAAYLTLSEKSVRRLVASRRLPCVRLGRVLRFQQADLLRFVKAREE